MRCPPKESGASDIPADPMYEFGSLLVRTFGKPNKIELVVLKLRQALNSAGSTTCPHGDGQGIYTIGRFHLDLFSAWWLSARALE